MKNPIVIPSFDLLRVHRAGQNEGPLKGSVGPLEPMDSLILLAHLVMLLPTDRQNVVLQRESDIVRLHAGKLHADLDAICVLGHIGWGKPGRSDHTSLLSSRHGGKRLVEEPI